MFHIFLLSCLPVLEEGTSITAIPRIFEIVIVNITYESYELKILHVHVHVRFVRSNKLKLRHSKLTIQTASFLRRTEGTWIQTELPLTIREVAKFTFVCASKALTWNSGWSVLVIRKLQQYAEAQFSHHCWLVIERSSCCAWHYAQSKAFTKYSLDFGEPNFSIIWRPSFHFSMLWHDMWLTKIKMFNENHYHQLCIKNVQFKEP